MAFVNEYITPQNVLKFNMQQDWELIQQPIIEKPNGKKVHFTGTFVGLMLDEMLLVGSERLKSGIFSESDAESKKYLSMRDFTVDREEDVYLRYGGRGREAWGDGGISYYMLYFKGFRIYSAIFYDPNLELSDPENKISAYTLFLKHIVVPKNLENNRESILLLIKDAIQVFSSSGIRSTYQYKLDFQF